MGTLVELLILSSQHPGSDRGCLLRPGRLLHIGAIVRYYILCVYRDILVCSFPSSCLCLQIIIDHLDALAFVQDLAAVLFIQPKWLNLPIAVLYVVRKHLRQKIRIVVLAIGGYSDSTWVIFDDFLVLILKKLGPAL